MEIIIASNVRVPFFFFLTYLDREISSRFPVMERHEIWGCVRGLSAVLYSNEQESGDQDMLSVHVHGTEHGSTNMISLISHLMDMEIVGHLARDLRGVS